jgi:DNA-binding CsgD family transcriptional regulator
MSTTTMDPTVIFRGDDHGAGAELDLATPARPRASDRGCSNCSTTPGRWVYVPVCMACGNAGRYDNEVHPGTDLLDTLHRIRGNTKRRDGTLKQRHRPFGWETLSTSELRIAQLVAAGMTNRQIGARLFSSPHTVGSHLRHIFRKLDIRSRVELTRLVVEHAQATDAAHSPCPSGP